MMIIIIIFNILSFAIPIAKFNIIIIIIIVIVIIVIIVIIVVVFIICHNLPCIFIRCFSSEDECFIEIQSFISRIP